MHATPLVLSRPLPCPLVHPACELSERDQQLDMATRVCEALMRRLRETERSLATASLLLGPCVLGLASLAGCTTGSL